MGLLLSVLLPLLFFQDPSQVQVYQAEKVTGDLVMDGTLSEEVWSGAPWSQDFFDIRGPEWPTPKHRTRVKLLWDDQFLYVAAELSEPHLWATLTERDAIIYRDDDFEVFLDPDGDGKNYFEVEINPHGTVLDLFLDQPYREGGRATIPWDLPGLKSGVTLQGTLNDPSDEDQGWTVELAIPWNELVPPEGDGSSGAHGLLPGATGQPPGPPSPGDEWRVNFSRVDWPLEVVPEKSSGRLTYERIEGPTPRNRHPEQNWVWSPQGEINMHIPSRWGVVRFIETRDQEARR